LTLFLSARARSSLAPLCTCNSVAWSSFAPLYYGGDVRLSFAPLCIADENRQFGRGRKIKRRRRLVVVWGNPSPTSDSISSSVLPPARRRSPWRGLSMPADQTWQASHESGCVVGFRQRHPCPWPNRGRKGGVPMLVQTRTTKPAWVRSHPAGQGGTSISFHQQYTPASDRCQALFRERLSPACLSICPPGSVFSSLVLGCTPWLSPRSVTPRTGDESKPSLRGAAPLPLTSPRPPFHL
jgi:hypothetical protein